MDDPAREAAKAECLDCAFWGGIRGAALGLTVSAPLTYAAHVRFKTIRRLTVSAKTALVVSPFFLGFFLNSELELHRCVLRQRGIH
ncbi:unnamed product [Ostreococcus tauri]|jgi:hypothetical protein|uniref:Unnamed product n=1 Tax=Ostreococcus tauri TaxID=70448 RepID=Q013C6_OSTTA|nr:unnamed product [Ostreococcus tauri]OUS47018.1 hypothetical protein BE221DRAFT_72701 [Ostreococcus tauri]CAL55004.1 unnamed product [Ostreococcus tauri]|eukprot:XP_003080836.1 unnamed product [Ostreococcus tauri]